MKIIDDGKHLLVYSNFNSYNSLDSSKNYSAMYEGGMNGVGFYLSPTKLFKKPDFKIYGSQINLVDKVLESFKRSSKSIGVILSGDKGTGKTIFSKMLSIKAHEIGLPTITVNDNTQGVADFLAKIDTSAVIMFDEFEKKFQDSMKSPDSDTQNDMLSLFDGLYGGKNIYVLTVNDIVDLSPYILNRPGRFMYSIRMSQPTPQDVHDYLEDKLDKDVIEREQQIKQIIQFSFKVPLSYDVLDALVFQLNGNNKFKEVLPSLNLLNFRDMQYNLDIVFSSGYTYHINSSDIDLFSETIKCNERDITFDFQSDSLKLGEDFLYVEGSDIKRVKVENDLKNKVQEGMQVQSVTEVRIKPMRSDDFGYKL